MKKECILLDLNQGPSEYQTNALEGMTMGDSYSIEQYFVK